MAVEKVKLTVKDKFKVELSGDKEGVREVLSIFFRGAAEMYLDQQSTVGRSREEVLTEMSRRIAIARAHFELGESDGFSCDLSDA